MAKFEETGKGLSERDRLAIASTLRAGGLTSFSLLATGLCIGMPGWPLHHSAVGNGLIHAGILTLLGTPVARILAACLFFWKAGERRYSYLCLISLVVICASALLGILLPHNRQ